MKKHKAIELLKTFSPGEVERFREFLYSPYYNKNSKVRVMFDEIIKHYPAFDSSSLEKKKIYEGIYGPGRYNDSTFRNLAAKLLNFAQKFLTVENSAKESINPKNRLLEELMNRNQNELFLMNTKKIESELSKSNEVDFNFLYNKYQFERNQFNFSIINDKIIQKKRVYPHIEKLTNSGSYLTIYYVTEIICQYLNLVVYSEKFNMERRKGTINYLLEELNIEKIYSRIKGKCDCDFILELYLMLYKAFSETETEEYFFKYKKLVNTYSNRLSADEISFHYSKLIVYCILKRKSKNYRYDFNIELFELYKTMLKKRYYVNHKIRYLSHTLFRDILLFSLKIKKLSWAKDFIKKYSQKVQPDERTNMYNYGQAFYHNETGDYAMSLNYINEISIDYFIYKYDLKNLKLKIYYELGYTEEALSITHSYKEFLRNNEFLSEERKTRHRNFVRFIEKLILHKAGSYKEDMGFVKREILSTPGISYKKWLMDKAEEMQKPY